MKMRNIIFIIFLAIPCLTWGQETELEKFANKYSDRVGYSSIYIPKHMLIMMDDLDDEQIKTMKEEVNSMTFITKEGMSDNTFKDDLLTLLVDNKYKLSLSLKVEGSEIIFIEREDNGKKTELVLFANMPDGMIFMFFSGEFSEEGLKNLGEIMNNY